MNSKKIFLLMMLVLVALIGCSSGDDDDPGPPPLPDTPAEFTARGWQFYESNHYDDALADFNSALVLESSYGEALAGKGWCGLKLSTGTESVTAAGADFSAAIIAGEDDSYVVAGLASVRLAEGGSSLNEADSLAGSIVADDPSFVFSHELSINATDMMLIMAFSQAALGQFSDALQRANLIEDSGIEPDYPSTWVVAGTEYTSFNAAVLAHLHQLSEEYSG